MEGVHDMKIDTRGSGQELWTPRVACFHRTLLYFLCLFSMIRCKSCTSRRTDQKNCESRVHHARSNHVPTRQPHRGTRRASPTFLEL